MVKKLRFIVGLNLLIALSGFVYGAKKESAFSQELEKMKEADIAEVQEIGFDKDTIFQELLEGDQMEILQFKLFPFLDAQTRSKFKGVCKAFNALVDIKWNEVFGSMSDENKSKFFEHMAKLEKFKILKNIINDKKLFDAISLESRYNVFKKAADNNHEKMVSHFLDSEQFIKNICKENVSGRGFFPAFGKNRRKEHLFQVAVKYGNDKVAVLISNYFSAKSRWDVLFLVSRLKESLQKRAENIAHAIFTCFFKKKTNKNRIFHKAGLKNRCQALITFAKNGFVKLVKLLLKMFSYPVKVIKNALNQTDNQAIRQELERALDRTKKE